MGLRIVEMKSELQPAIPLGQRLPANDENGHSLNDFMLIIPGLKHWPPARRERVCDELNRLLGRHAGRVVYADLNIKLNLLWVSHRQGKGVSLALFQAIRELVPEALLVASQAELMRGLQRQARRRWGIRGLLGWRG